MNAAPFKVKTVPEDFRVDECTRFPVEGGSFAVYRLEKHGLGTLEAIEAIGKQWRLVRGQTAFGGLKDRHASTRQTITIHGGPDVNFKQDRLRLQYLGQAERHFQSSDITANRFVVVLRDVDPSLTARLQGFLTAMGENGVPNYFDEQRFGSVGPSGEFMAHAWCRGDYERALQLVIAEPDPHDRAADRSEKEMMRRFWGRWEETRHEFAHPERRAAARHLRLRPGDYRGAITCLPQEHRSLYLAAFQSMLWNRLLAATIKEVIGATKVQTIRIGVDQLPIPLRLQPSERGEIAACALPLPTARNHLEEGPVRRRLERVLGEFGLEQRQLRVKYPRDSFFSKGDRAAWIKIAGLEHTIGGDDMNLGRDKMEMRFELPRGAYATILVKYLSLLSTQQPSVDDPARQDD